VDARRYRLGMADGSYGPGDVEPLTISMRRVVKGPPLPNWHPESILASLDTPIEWRGELVSFVALSPRYTTDTLSSIRELGGVVCGGTRSSGIRSSPMDGAYSLRYALLGRGDTKCPGGLTIVGGVRDALVAWRLGR
jgi:hypothetical protein